VWGPSAPRQSRTGTTTSTSSPGLLLRSELEIAGATAPSLDAEVMIGTFAVEGLLMHPLSEDPQRAICDLLAQRWIPTPTH